jgi:hypothetical protein
MGEVMYIRIDENLEIPRGNFGFVYDKTGDSELFELLLASESVYRISYGDFAHKLRMAYESVAIWFEIQYLKEHGLDGGKSDSELKKQITSNVINPNYTIRIGNQPNQYYNFKNMLIRYTYDFPEKFDGMLQEFSFNQKKNSRDNLAQYIRYIYDFGSKSSHVNENTEKKYLPNKRNAERAL